MRFVVMEKNANTHERIVQKVIILLFICLARMRITPNVRHA